MVQSVHGGAKTTRGGAPSAAAPLLFPTSITSLHPISTIQHVFRMNEYERRLSFSH